MLDCSIYTIMNTRSVGRICLAEAGHILKALLNLLKKIETCLLTFVPPIPYEF